MVSYKNSREEERISYRALNNHEQYQRINKSCILEYFLLQTVAIKRYGPLIWVA